MSENTKNLKNILKRKEETLKSQEVFRKENKVWICGEIAEEFEFDIEKLGRKFYSTRVKVKRLSGIVDYVPIVVSEELLKPDKSLKGKIIELGGQFHSIRRRDKEGKKHLLLYVLAKVIKIHDDKENLEENDMNINVVYLEGVICKEPTFKTTQLGRDIAEILLKVRTTEHVKFAFIPCIAWGNNAYYACQRDEPFRAIKVYGRIQSREYNKKYENGEEVTKVAYELSICDLKDMNGFAIESDR